MAPSNTLGDVRFSNRPVGVKHFQAIHHCSVDVAHGLALLFGIGTKALPSWDPRTRRNNLLGGLAVSRTAGPSGHANSPHPSSREGHLSTAGWSSSFLLLDLILHGCHAAAALVLWSSGTARCYLRPKYCSFLPTRSDDTSKWCKPLRERSADARGAIHAVMVIVSLLGACRDRSMLTSERGFPSKRIFRTRDLVLQSCCTETPGHFWSR